ncbi:cytochrome P450 [Xylaria acuta]|nr:cytochrome P450 [Xylaria acuta]
MSLTRTTFKPGGKRRALNGRKPRLPPGSNNGVVNHNRKSLLLPEEPWKERRRVIHSLLNGSALKQYGAWQEEESAQMMAEYVIKPDMWYKHYYRYANLVVYRITLGERLFNIGTSLIDWFPEWEKLTQWNYEVEAGTAPPSFIRDKDSMYVAMQLIEAGTDTTREALNVLVMATLEYIEPFKKARAKIGEVCGAGYNARWPCLEDMESLQYICAMAKEVLRWRPIFALTPDHTLSQDIEFEGYYFPAGVSFAINEVAHFEGRHWICVSYQLTQRSLFINIARLVQYFNYEAAGTYDPHELDLEFIEELFPVKPRLRSEDYKN